MSEYFIKPIVKTLMLKGETGSNIKDISQSSPSAESSSGLSSK